MRPFFARPGSNRNDSQKFWVQQWHAVTNPEVFLGVEWAFYISRLFTF